MLDTQDIIPAHIRDVDRLGTVMDNARPDEAFKTNVLGTRNVLMTVREQEVRAFVNVSTDKAAHEGKCSAIRRRRLSG